MGAKQRTDLQVKTQYVHLKDWGISQTGSRVDNLYRVCQRSFSRTHSYMKVSQFWVNSFDSSHGGRVKLSDLNAQEEHVSFCRNLWCLLRNVANQCLDCIFSCKNHCEDTTLLVKDWYVNWFYLSRCSEGNLCLLTDSSCVVPKIQTIFV